MPRPPRIEVAGAVYHVTSRGNARQTIFSDQEDRARFLAQLVDGLDIHDATLHAYVLMSNHYHLLVRTNRPNLSRFIQRLNTSYSLYFRYKHARPGHLFQGRYNAKLVADDEYLLRLTRYIHLNPVKIEAVQRLSAAERLLSLERYRWSSYAGYVNAEKAVSWVDYRVLRTYGRSWPEARRRYRAYTRALVAEDDEALSGVLRSNAYAVGDAAFVEDVKARLQRAADQAGRSRDVNWPKGRTAFTRIDELVARTYGIAPAQLRVHGHRAGEGKRVALELAVRYSGETMRHVGAHYGQMTSSAVAMARRRVREGGPALRKRIAFLAAELGQS